MNKPFETPVALRCWIEEWLQSSGLDGQDKPTEEEGPNSDEQSRKGEWRKIKIGEAGLVFDLETTTDELQSLRVGAFKAVVENAYSGLFVADDLRYKDAEGYAIAKEYAEKRGMLFLTRRRFIKEVFYPIAYDIGGVVVGFNLPFDLSRLADSVTVSEGENRDRFRLYLRNRLENPQATPDIGITPISEHAAKIEFLPAAPKGSEKKWLQYFRGRFLDLHQAIYAITGENHNLRSAGEAFGASILKQEIEEEAHGGPITEEYLDYLCNDIKATLSLGEAVVAVYDQFPFATDMPEDYQGNNTPITKLYSPASVAKALYRKMGIPPQSEVLQRVPHEYLGYAMAAYYGGRIECRIRKTPVAVTLLDFTSQYPAVFTLLRLMPLLTASQIEIEECKEEVESLLNQIKDNPNVLYDRGFWPQLAAFVQIQPDGDFLPVRAPFGAGDSGDLSDPGLAVTTFTSPDPMWYGLPDIAASIILTGKIPSVIRAFKVKAISPMCPIIPISLRWGSLTLNPRDPAMFARMVEERKRLEKEGQSALAWGIKQAANCGCYGVTMEFDRNPLKIYSKKIEKSSTLESSKNDLKTKRINVKATLYSEGISQHTFVGHIEKPGEFTNPFIGSLVAAGGRLLLAMLQREVERRGDSAPAVRGGRGGTFMWTATDAMAVVTSDEEVAAIQAKFNRLNPYNLEVVPQFLKVEASGIAFAISSNRYCISPISPISPFIKISFSGMGGIIPPLCDRLKEFAPLVWKSVLDGETPSEWEGELLRRKLPIRKPATWQMIKSVYPAIRPFGFLQSVSESRPYGNIGESRVFYTPYRKGSKSSLKLKWVDAHTGERVEVRPSNPDLPLSGGKGLVYCETIADFVRNFPLHPERKMMGQDGEECMSSTSGTLTPRPVIRSGAYLIGKESDPLAVETEEETSTEVERVKMLHRDLSDLRFSVALQKLKDYPQREIAAAVNVCQRQWRKIRAGQHTPYKQTADKIIRLAYWLPIQTPTSDKDRKDALLEAIRIIERR